MRSLYLLPYLLSKPLRPGQPCGAAVQAHKERGVTQGLQGSSRVWAGGPQISGCFVILPPTSPRPQLAHRVLGAASPTHPCPPMAHLSPCLRCWDPAGASPCRPIPSATSSPQPPRQELLLAHTALLGGGCPSATPREPHSCPVLSVSSPGFGGLSPRPWALPGTGSGSKPFATRTFG